jgi:hypothetical protein
MTSASGSKLAAPTFVDGKGQYSSREVIEFLSSLPAK